MLYDDISHLRYTNSYTSYKNNLPICILNVMVEFFQIRENEIHRSACINISEDTGIQIFRDLVLYIISKLEIQFLNNIVMQPRCSDILGNVSVLWTQMVQSTKLLRE